VPIDHPLDAVSALDASDQRPRSPVWGLGRDFPRIVKLFAPPGSGIPLAALETALDWLGRQQADRREELLRVIVEELRYRGQQTESLRSADEEHRKSIEDEMPGLVLAALSRAEQTRAKERVRHLGRILVHAAEVGPSETADTAEEMMRMAVELGSRDVTILQQLDMVQRQLTSKGVIQREQVNEAWRDRPPRLPDMGENEIQSICAKLQSFGLAVRIERNSFKLGAI